MPMKKLILLLSLMPTIFTWADDSIAVEQTINDSVQLLSVPQPQRPKIMEDMQENVQFFGDETVYRLLKDKEEGVVREEVQIQGYRVQVFSSNKQQTAKTEAFRIQKIVEKSSLETEVYVLYNPPFWKVRLGNFRTQAEALLLKEEVIKALPELQGNTYVVRDQITVLQ